MDRDQQLHQAAVRLKWLKSNSDSKLDFDEYKFKFEKIMNVLDQNDINIDARLEDLLFNAGLPDKSKHFRNIEFKNSSRRTNSTGRRITSENDSKYKRDFKDDKYSYGGREEDENNNLNNYDSDKSSTIISSSKRDLKRFRDDDNHATRSTRRRSDNRFDELRSSRNLSPRNDSPLLDSFSSKYEIGEKIDFLEYHKSNGHCDSEVLEKQAQKQKIEIINRTDCENCLNHKVMINCLKDLNPKPRSHKSLEVIHCYLSAEFPITGFTGVKSFFLLIDDYTRMIFIYTVRNENEVVHILFKFLKHCEKFQEHGARTIVTEDRPEFIDPELEIFLRKNNIGHEKTTNSGQGNRFIDYYVKQIQIMLKLLIADADGIDPALWSEAIKCAVYIYNNLPNKYLNWMTPCEKWKDKSLKFADRLYPFGSWFMAQFEQNTYRGNFSSARYSKCRFVGYHPHSPSLFRFYNPYDGNSERKTIGFGKIAHRLDSPKSTRSK